MKTEERDQKSEVRGQRSEPSDFRPPPSALRSLPSDPTIVLFCSRSRAAEPALCRFIANHNLNLSAIIMVSQVRGGRLAGARAAWSYWRDGVDPAFLLYKLRDHFAGRKLRRMARMCNRRVILTNDVNGFDTIRYLRNLGPDLGISCFANQKFEAPLLNCFKGGIWNVHGSLLPRGRGVAQYWHWSEAGSRRAEGRSRRSDLRFPISDLRSPPIGVTLAWMDGGFDTGDIIAQEAFPVTHGTTPAALHAHIAERGLELASRALYDLEQTGQVARTPQHPTNEPPLRLPRKALKQGAGSSEQNNPACSALPAPSSLLTR